MSSVLQCVHCRAGTLVKTAEMLVCGHCGMTYPIVHGVAIFYPGVRIEPFTGLSAIAMDELAQAICQYQELPLTPAMLAAVTLIFRQVYRFPDRFVNAEVRIPEILKSIGPVAAAIMALLPDEEDLQAASGEIYRITSDYLPRIMSAGDRLTGNVCLLNSGSEPIDSRPQVPATGTIYPIYLSYHWLSAEGAMRVYDGERTALPIVLSPGRQITLPMLIQVPIEPGDYQLQICLVQEQVAWRESTAKPLAIQVVEPADRPPSLIASWRQDQVQRNYYDDHQYAIGLLKEQLATIGGTPHLLEIGGNACPMLQLLQCDFPSMFYNLDIDIPGLQISHLTNQSKEINIMSICGNVDDIPFDDFSLDAIIIFASLHHLANPGHTLQQLARKIQPQGFIAILCEPVGHYYCPQIIDPANCVDADLLEALRQGVNEQTFSLDEYAAMFQRSGLIATRVEVNGTSLKAFLTRPVNISR